ncbi:MAG: PorT family protein [Sphingobacteriales bacterium]|nr:PorT family protein [Sphingobacteriales bacterium]
MKKILFITALAFGCYSANAQKKTSPVNFGLKGGLNVSNLTTNGSGFDYQFKPSFHAGGLLHIHLGDKYHRFALQPELLFSRQGASFNDITNTKYNVALNYIAVPVLFQYMFGNGFRLETGPQVSAMLDAQRMGAGKTVNVSSSFKPVDFSWVFGGGYVWKSGFGLDARINAGLSDINNVPPSNTTVRNLVFAVGAFYIFNNERHMHKSQ